MTDEPAVEDLLLIWEDAQERGENLTPEALCGSCPQHLEAVRAGIRGLEELAAVLDLRGGRGQSPAPPDYEILGELGAGGMGVVYKAQEHKLNRVVALKMPHGGPLAGPEQAERFRRETQVLAGLEHDHVVRLYHADVHEGRPYFVMQFVGGGCLDGHGGRYRDDPRAAATLVARVARAVQYAHERGVLHRDLKPGNILLDDDGKPLVSDFGLAMLLTPVGETLSASPRDTDVPNRVTRPGDRPGTPAYMAPEQTGEGVGEVTAAADVWALGVVLYELVTGRQPFVGQTREEVWGQIRGAVPPGPRRVNPRVGRSLERVILRCLEKDARRRYPTAAALAAALERCCTRRGLLRAWAAPALTAVAILAAVLFWLWGRTPDPEQEYLNALAPVLHRIERLQPGESVDLVPGEGLPPHFLRQGQGATFVRRAKEGLNLYSTSLGLVELLPHVPLKRYEIVIELQHSACEHPQLGMIGPYWGACHLKTSKATHHLFHLFRMNDCRPHGMVRDAEGHLLHNMWFRFLGVLVWDAPVREGRPFEYRSFNTDGVRSGDLYRGAAEGATRPWRVIVLTVDERQAAAKWQVPPELQARGWFAPLKHADRDDFLQAVRTERPPPEGVGMPGLNEAEDQQFNSKGIGILICCGRCVVRRFEIRCLP